jgi:hypothetical protein
MVSRVLLSSIFLRSRLVQLGAYKSDEWFEKILDEFENGPDNLHNSMGLTETVLENMLGEWICKEKFNSKLQTRLRRLYLSSCKGSDFRFIVLNWESFIYETHIDYLTKEQQKSLFDFFYYWSEILWISYQSNQVQKNQSFQLLFNVRLYQLSKVFQGFPSHWKLNNLYIHNVLAHSSEYFSKTDLLLLSCEFGEQAFSRLSQFVSTKSNHKIQDLYQNFLIYEQTSLQVAKTITKDPSSSS